MQGFAWASLERPHAGQARPLETGRPQWPAGYPAPQGKRPERPQSPGRSFVARSGNAGLVAARTFERQVVELQIRAALFEWSGIAMVAGGVLLLAFKR